MDISNKKVHFLGDSITNGACATEKTCFVGLFQETYPNAEITNYGIGGTRIAPQTQPSAEPIWDYDFVARAKDMTPDADLIVVFGGTNDFGHGDAPFGEVGMQDKSTFCGAVYTLFNDLLLKYPYAKILVLTPLHRSEESNERGLTLSQYVQAIKEIATYFSFPVLDLYACSGMNPNVARVKETLMPDGLHPNEMGHKRLFELINAYIKNML